MAENLWKPAEASGLSGLELLVYRSNLLGHDRSVSNWGGGNTSMKARGTDFRGRELDILWVKGSGSDLATITPKGFAGLRMEDILPLLDRQEMPDDEMAAYLAHCLLNPSMPRQSIETLLHAFLPFKHIDHTHADNIIALATSLHGEEITREVFGDEAIWQPYIRPGFTLAREIARQVAVQPQARLVVMARHGLLTWGDTAQQCYENTLAIINRAGEVIAARSQGRAPYGGAKVAEIPQLQRRELLSTALPSLRGAISTRKSMILRVDESPEAMQFVDGVQSRQLALTGAACPDHLVHTRHLPLWVDFDPAHHGQAELLETLQRGVADYAEMYCHYFEENKTPDFPMDDPVPRVILIPGIGMVTSGRDARLADISAQLYSRAIQVMRSVSGIDQYVSLTPAESYGVEYWPLERYKLTLLPPERELAGKVALVTGGASGIGKAISQRLAQEGAHVAIADIDSSNAARAAQELCDSYGLKRGLAVECDVTREESVAQAFREVTLAYGGVDIVVSNAGLARAHPIEDTSLEEWNRIFNVLAAGYFLVARQAFRLWRTQGNGGNLIFIASKNALTPGKNASAYSAAKASELQLARVLAEEGGPAGIRVNTICPDAVVQGSGIWNSAWREERARDYGVRPDEIEAFYRQRSTLKVNVYPEDIAEAALFLASPRASKTTGAVITVDGGVPAAYVR